MRQALAQAEIERMQLALDDEKARMNRAQVVSSGGSLRDMEQAYLGEVKLRLELEAEIEKLEELLKRAKDLAEYWINRECTINYSQQEYNSWLALGHQSNTMEAIRTALAKKMREES